MITLVLLTLLRILCNTLEPNILISDFTFSEIMLKKGYIVLHFVETDFQFADIFMKPLDTSRFVRLRSELGVVHPMGLFCGGAIWSKFQKLCLFIQSKPLK